ncbi:MAG: hypothetical protein OIF47_15115 [Marinibacterium sp.]|nr:hypothetical protein [Marinibacterium sp.]
MARGFFNGMIVGGAAGLAGLAALSLLRPLPAGPDLVGAAPVFGAVAGLDLPADPGAGGDAVLLDLDPSQPAPVVRPAAPPDSGAAAPVPVEALTVQPAPTRPDALAPELPGAPRPTPADAAPEPIVPALPEVPGSAGRAITSLQPPEPQAVVEFRPMPERAGRPPLERFAAPFVARGDAPLMAVMLLDGPDGADLAELQGLGLPVSIVIDPAHPEAARRMARYRDAGFETLMRADLANRDLSALATGMALLPKSVAVFDVGGVDAGTTGVAAALAAGRGVIADLDGLDAPVAPVLRDLDGAGQGATVIRRFLDQAGVRAGQGLPVIVLGRMRPDTITALADWQAGPVAARVQPAPVSALLLAR